MAKIVLTRHGQTAWNVPPPRFRGRADLPLSPLGAEQAGAVARRIAASYPLSALYTSPLQRCRTTAQAIADAAGLAVNVVDALVDIDYGAWEGLTEDDVARRWPAESAAWLHAPQYAQPVGGESLQDVLARVSASIRELLRRHAEEAFGIVAHDAVNRIMLSYALDMPLSRYRSLAQDNCAISEIDFVGGAFTVTRVNDVSHLQGLHR